MMMDDDETTVKECLTRVVSGVTSRVYLLLRPSQKNDNSKSY